MVQNSRGYREIFRDYSSRSSELSFQIPRVFVILLVFSVVVSPGTLSGIPSKTPLPNLPGIYSEIAPVIFRGMSKVISSEFDPGNPWA